MLRKPDSIPSRDTIIEDPAMEPYFITKSDAGGYTIYKRVIRGENNTKYIDALCYPSTFNSALKRTAKYLQDHKNKHYKTVGAYLKAWEEIKDKMSSIANVD